MPIVDANDPQTWDVHPDKTRGQWNVGTNFYLPGSGPNWSEVRVGYIRALHGPNGQAGKTVSKIVSSLGITVSDKVVLIGDSYGWASEIMSTLGVASVPIDNSSLVQTNKDLTETSMIRDRIVAAGLDPDVGVGADALAALDDGLPRARVDILNEDASTNGSRNRIVSALGGKPTWAVTMKVATWLTDAEMVSLSADLHLLANNVAHVITPYSETSAKEDEPDPVNNWKHVSKSDPLTNKLESQVWFTERSWKALLPDDWIVVTGSYNAYF